jgi:hypothetical protein
MRYERRKEFTALLSLLSVAIAVVAAAFTVFYVEGFGKLTETFLIAFAASVAALSASMSIFVSRRLAVERERRRVFLIYAREDLEIAKKLAGELRERGFRPWLDVEEVIPGQVWQKAVVRGLEESAAALVLVSKNLEKKGFVQKELEVALETLQEREKDLSPVLPVRVDDSQVPERLAHVQWVNLFEDSGLDRLTMGLKRILA